MPQRPIILISLPVLLYRLRQEPVLLALLQIPIDATVDLASGARVLEQICTELVYKIAL